MLTALAMNKKLGAKFYIHREVFHYIRTLKDANSAFIYTPVGGAQANTIWGYPWEEVEQMPYTDGSNKPIALLGNLRYYILGRRMQNTTLDADPYGAFTTDQTRFRMYWRMAFALGRSTAFVRLMTKT
jgi:HK97 family phage major capsid protein